ncbi:uncharacterized protein LOC144667419 isoform X2 [Oculina patagonica]
MAETQEHLRQGEEEVKIGQVTKFLQCLDAVLTENRNIFTVLPELHKHFVELEANMTKKDRTVAGNNNGELSGNKEGLEYKREQWQTQQKRLEKQITRLEKDLKDANQTISNLELKNKQHDKDVEMLKEENRDKQDKNYHQSKCKDLKAKLRTTKEDLKTKQDQIAELGRELRSKQEDYDKEMQRSREELAVKEKTLAKTKEELDMVKQQSDECCRDQKTKINKLEARIAELGNELLSKQEDLEKEVQRNQQQSVAKDKANEELIRQIQEYGKRNENLNTEMENKKLELQHYMERFKQQEENFKTGLSRKEMEVNQLKQRLAGICEKRVKQDQRMVENVLALNQQSEVENDFREFFDSNREDARDIIQSIYGSEEEIDVHVYYPRIACTIFETAYEHVNDVKKAVIDLFKEITKKMIHHAPEMGRNFRLTRTDGNFVFNPISIDDHNTSEESTDVLDALLISLKETSHVCNLQCLEKDVAQSAWEKWNEWYDEDTSFVHTPSWDVLTQLSSYTKECIRLTWRMVTQLPPLRVEYQSSNFDCSIHKKTAYHDMAEKNPGNEETSSAEIACYLWPGLYDGGVRLIRPGEVLCKIEGDNFK